MAVLNYAKNYQQALDTQFPHVLKFGDLYNSPSNSLYRWTGAKTIEIPTITTTGRKDADRDTIGTPARHFDNAWEEKTLTNMRYWDTLVHPMDIDQTNQVASIGNITRVYNEQQKFPEMDAYCVSKIYSLWTGKAKTASVVALTETNVLDELDKMMQKMDEENVPDGRILYVTPAVNTLIKNASQVTRQITVDGSNNGTIQRKVSRIDDVTIKQVSSKLMKTVYDFTSGWVAGAGAGQINMFLIHPMAVMTPHVYNFASLDEPTAKTQGKYYYYEESYEDVFLLDNKISAIDFNITAGV